MTTEFSLFDLWIRRRCVEQLCVPVCARRLTVFSFLKYCQNLRKKTKIATQKIRESGFQNQIDVKAGSFLSDQIPNGYDLITLIRVLYDHSDENVLKILKSVDKK